MDRAGALAALNSRILAAYSAMTIEALRAKLPLRVALPYLEPVLALNVRKEARKDRMIIRHAAEALARGEAPQRDAAKALFAATQAVDQEFLQRVEDFPVRIFIRYEEIEPLRLSRICYVLDTAYRILAAWRERIRLRAAVRQAYPQADLELVISMILDLYARETRALSRAVRLPTLLIPVGEHAAAYLSSVMGEVAARLAREVAQGVYRH